MRSVRRRPSWKERLYEARRYLLFAWWSLIYGAPENSPASRRFSIAVIRNLRKFTADKRQKEGRA